MCWRACCRMDSGSTAHSHLMVKPIGHLCSSVPIVGINVGGGGAAAAGSGSGTTAEERRANQPLLCCSCHAAAAAACSWCTSRDLPVPCVLAAGSVGRSLGMGQQQQQVGRSSAYLQADDKHPCMSL